MSCLEIHRFGPDDAGDTQAAVDISHAVSAVDTPWEHPEPASHYEALLRHGWDGEPPTPYLLSVEGLPVGLGSVSLTERENTRLAGVSVAIHPEHRRNGYGSVLVRRMFEEARATGRTTVGMDGWESEAVTAFAAKFGLARKSQAIMRRQHLEEVDRSQVQKLYDDAAGTAADYELFHVVGRTPPEMAADMVELTAAINDAPTDGLDIEDDVMSVERLVAYEEAVEARGNRLYRLVARHRRTGDLGGHTVIAVEEHRPTVAHQHDTAVARAHRGHRLGLLLKAGMLLWLAEAEPHVETVDTWNAESNDRMIGVNEALGYRVMARELQFQRCVTAG